MSEAIRWLRKIRVTVRKVWGLVVSRLPLRGHLCPGLRQPDAGPTTAALTLPSVQPAKLIFRWNRPPTATMAESRPSFDRKRLLLSVNGFLASTRIALLALCCFQRKPGGLVKCGCPGLTSTISLNFVLLLVA